MRQLKLYCSSKHIPDEDTRRRWPILQECNEGFHLAIYCLWLLKGHGFEIEIIDTSLITDAERKNIYDSIISLTVVKKYGVRRVFGTKHRSGIRFGKQVPALLEFEDEVEQVVDVYPRHSFDIDKRRELVTIIQRLNELLRPIIGMQMDRITDYRIARRAYR